MTRHTNGASIRRWLAPLTVGASLLGPLAGCKESVTLAFYDGLENIAVAMVQAFFDAITPTFSTSASATDFLSSVQHGLA